jgi:epidermal growth factor receptor substrate 15
MATTGVEKQYYDQLFKLLDPQDVSLTLAMSFPLLTSAQTGCITGEDALPLLTSSGLPAQQLGEIWAIADPNNNGFLTKDGWYAAARVAGWLQKGNKTEVDQELASKPGPYPTFKGYLSPPEVSTPLSTNVTGTPLSANATSSALPPLTAANRTNFTGIFVRCGPSNGLISGDKARDVFLKSKLNYDKLGRIW